MEQARGRDADVLRVIGGVTTLVKTPVRELLGIEYPMLQAPMSAVAERALAGKPQSAEEIVTELVSGL
jgi:hypothetical protein